jgi:cell division protein FtsL
MKQTLEKLMLATLAIINMAVAGALISESYNTDSAQQEATLITTTVNTTEQTTDYISWSEE